MKCLPIIVAAIALLAVGCGTLPKEGAVDHPAAKPAPVKKAEAPPAVPDEKAGPKATKATEEELDELLGDDLEFLGDKDEFETVEVPDPLYHWNRAWFYFNDGFYYTVLEPTTRGYQAVVPYDFRLIFKNFFHNLGFPIRFVSSLLQGKGGEAGDELGSFLINSTLGVLGFGTPAQDVWGIGLNDDDEDMGQTLGVWGFGEGLYLVWPIMGPSSLRDTVGMVGDYYLDPITYVEPQELALGIRALEMVNATSFRLGDYESMKDFALDPYISMRNFYIQMRRKQVSE